MMNSYWNMMEQVKLSDRKKEEIMDMLEQKQTQKRRMPSVAKMALAAALAVGCVLSIAAGLPVQVYNFLGSGSLTVDARGGALSVADENKAPVVLQDGRLWFDNGEERTDITDLIDGNTPYIYEHTDPATGNKGYVIVGGTPDDFGWAELVQLGDTTAITGINFGTAETPSPLWLDNALNQLSIEY